MNDLRVLHITLHNMLIGTLILRQGDRSVFAFEQSYIDNPLRPTLGQAFMTRDGQVLEEHPAKQRRLLPFFSNLLPEGSMRTYLAQTNNINPEREFLLLEALGQDLPGALSVFSDDRPWAEGLEPGPLLSKPSTTHAEMRFSLAGVQMKFSALMKGKGMTIPVKGIGGDWIVKLPSRQFRGLPENEHAMMSLASRLKMDVPETKLVDIFDIEGIPALAGDFDSHALAVRRFDRTLEKGRVHIEDFAQVFNIYPEYKYRKANYRNIASVLQATAREEDVQEFIRRLVFSTLTGNADMHLKNWSLIYRDGLTPALSPAYDLLSTIPYISEEKMALKYARTARIDEFTWDELSYLAAKAEIPHRLSLKTAWETVEAFLDVWSQEKVHLLEDKRVIDAIDANLKRLPITRGKPPR